MDFCFLNVAFWRDLKQYNRPTIQCAALVNCDTTTRHKVQTLLLPLFGSGTDGYSSSVVFTARCTIVQSAVLRSHVVRLSVRLSVTLVDHDHVRWQSWKLIARKISPTSSLFVSQRTATYAEGNMGKFGGDWRWGGKKWRSGAQKRQYL